MVDVLETIDKLTKSFQERLTARTAYGEPISANGVTVVPVAKIGFGFGGGGGGGSGSAPVKGDGALQAVETAIQSGSGGGGGGGGGGVVQPMGFIEITEAGARWVPLEPPRAEFVLRALMALAVVAPGGGRGGFFRRLMLMLAGQAAIGAFLRPRTPSMPDAWASDRRMAEQPA
jgi:uncharacterized spore protein YtfJ